jgi:hypothetical protein
LIAVPSSSCNFCAFDAGTAGSVIHLKPDGWRFSERVHEIKYLDTTPLAGSPPHAAEGAR